MHKEKQLDRMKTIVEASVKLLLTTGYRRTQMADIAREAGISSGTIYNYFAGKEALFDFLIRKEMLLLPPDQWPEIPIATPKPGATLKFIKSETRKGIAFFADLEAAVARDECPDPRSELETIVRRYFSTLSQSRIFIMLLDKSALDWPEMADVYDRTIRSRMKKLLKQYLDKRISQKHFRQVPDAFASVRLIMHIMDWFAKLRPYSSDAGKIGEEIAEETVVDALLQTFIPEPRS
ncbi:MAG: TetR/AcrR family transcriptional regulator [Proteobacteria bacterium]|nr:TetR/AcrR family transcriptional regulator [Pseudomonadota bacterium]